jgi:hypothetical protein
MPWRYNIADARDIKDAEKRTERYLEAQTGQQHTHSPTHSVSTSVTWLVPGAGLEPALRLREKGF